MSTNGITRVRQYILGWIGLPVMAVLNGVLREFTYCKVVGEDTAHQISAIILCMIICVYVILLNSRIQLKNSREAFFAGFVWMILTIMFEVLLSSTTGIPLEEQLRSYDPTDGNLWVLVVITVLVAPVILRGHRLIRLFG